MDILEIENAKVYIYLISLDSLILSDIKAYILLDSVYAETRQSLYKAQAFINLYLEAVDPSRKIR